MKQIVIAWIEENLAIIGHPDDLLDTLLVIVTERGLDGAREYLTGRAARETIAGDSFEAGISLGLMGGIEILMRAEQAAAQAAA